MWFSRQRRQRTGDELRFHRDRLIDEYMRGGMDRKAAERRAFLEFGNVAALEEASRDVRGRLLEDLGRDLRYTVRTLRRSPGFAAAAILSLALGIGANSAVFSTLDAVILRPLPFPDADRLVRLRQVRDDADETNIAPIRLEDWHRLNSAFEAITGYGVEDVADTSSDPPEMVRRAFVAPRFFQVWGVPPAMGRAFTDEEHSGGGPQAIVISDRYWQQRLGASPDVLGRPVRLGNNTFPIVGVMSSTFMFPDQDVDMWFPVQMGGKLAEARSATWYTGIGRLREHVTVEQARANLATVQARLGDEYPRTDGTIRADVTPLKDDLVGDTGRSLWFLFGAVSVLLLITCTNVAALLLTRAAERSQEIAVRLALGATRAGLIRQLLTEAVVLAVVGGAAGLVVAFAASGAFRYAAGEIPRIDEVGLNWRIVLYTLAISTTAAVLCGLLPAMRSSRPSLSSVSRGTGRGQVSTRHSLQWFLVGGQVALSVTLLTGAGLMARSFQALSQVEPGFDPSHLLTFRVSGTWAETADYARLSRRVDDTIEALQMLPGVEAAATAAFPPGVPAQYESTFMLAEARRETPAGIVAESRFVSPEYFAALRIRIVEGQTCTRRTDGARDVMVNRTFVTRYLSDHSSAIGLHLSTDEGASSPGRIAGVVADARERGLDREPGPVVYTCFSAPNPFPYFLARTRANPEAMAQTVRLRLKDLEPLRAVHDVRSLEDRLGGAFAENRLRTVLLALFAATALSLATVGLYGTLTYAVSLRRREIGLRLALGARRADIVRQFLERGLLVAGVGCLCGVLASVAAARAVTALLFGVSPYDLLTFVAVIAVTLIVAGVAALVPATRAAFTEPVDALRQD